jgi:phosphatidate cytidylyltransferase
MISMFAAALYLGTAGVAVLFGGAAILAMREYIALVPGRVPRPMRVLMYAATVMQFGLAVGGFSMAMAAFLPVTAALVVPVVWMACSRANSRQIARVQQGLLAIPYTLAWIVPLADLGPTVAPGAAVVAVVVLTELSDVGGYIWGKSLGQRKLCPALSPGKTVAGAVGAFVTASVLATLVLPPLVGVSPMVAPFIGGLLAVVGLAGDLTVSAMKRQARVKDAGGMLPGHGGVLDRLDSLTFTVPVGFAVLYVLCGA